MRIPDLNESQLTQFWENYKSWEGRVSELYLKHAGQGYDTRLVNDTAINLSDMLNALPWQSRHDLLHQYRTIIDFDRHLDTARGIGSLRAVGTTGELSKFAIQDLNPDNPVAVVLNRLNIRHDPTRALRLGRGFSNDYFGANILRSDALQAAMEAKKNAAGFAAGGKAFIFDTETVGLATSLAGVREVAGGTYSLQGDTMLQNMVESAHFKTAGMQFGMAFDRGRARLLGDVFDHPGAIAHAKTGSGDEFAQKMIPFLNDILKADYVAGHNVEFDIRQTITNLMRTAAYKDIDHSMHSQIAPLVDQVFEKVVKTPGTIIDTRELLMQRMPNLGLANELANTGKLAPFSLENVVLQTNLVENMIRDMRREGRDYEAFFRGAQHTAEYDTTLTAYLLRYLSTENGLQAKSLGTKGILGEIRANTIRATATIPTAHIKDINHLDPALFRAIVERKYEGDPLQILNARTGRAANLARSPLGKKGSGDVVQDWIDVLSKPNQTKYMLKSNISYLEQEIWAARQGARPSVAAGVSAETLADGLGVWRRFAGIDTAYEGMLNQDSSIFKMGVRPSEIQFSKMVDSMASLGNEFANLSVPERMLTNALAAASSIPGSEHTPGSMVASRLQRMGVGAERAAYLGDDLGIIHFASQTAITGGDNLGQMVSLPRQVLSEAGIWNDEIQMLELSPFEKAGKAVNLRFNLGKGQADILSDWLLNQDLAGAIGDSSLREMGITSQEQLMRLAENVRGVGAETGIAIGYLDAKAGRAGYDAFTTLFGTVDRGRAPIRVAFGRETEGVIQTGPAMLDRFITPQRRNELAGKVGRTLTQFDNLSSYLQDTKAYRHVVNAQKDTAAREAGVSLSEMVANKELGMLYRRGKSVLNTPRGRAGLVVGAAALGGYYFLRRHQRREAYVAPFEEMPIEREHPNRPDAYLYTGQNNGNNGFLDPFATASTVQYMDRNKTNHTRMGKDKYSGLFGGAI